VATPKPPPKAPTNPPAKPRPATPVNPATPVKPSPATKAPPEPAGASVPVVKTTAPPIDLATLRQELKDTKAIGLLSKLTLKNQMDDLLNRFRGYYEGDKKLSMTELRRSYDLLVMKLMSLVQDKDQKLAADIASSREAIWGLLSDPVKFASLKI
jgi:hypothetical protein